MHELADITAVLADFQRGVLTPEQFVARYLSLWRALREEQYTAIDAQPAIRGKLAQLAAAQRDGSLDAEQYQTQVQAEYGKLRGLRLPPGSLASESLSQLMGVVEGYRPNADAPGEVYVTAAQLHAAVAETLAVLTP